MNPLEKESLMTETLKEFSAAIADVVEQASDSVVRVEGRRRIPASGIVWSREGLILTANHVLKRDEGLHVGLPSGERTRAEIVGRDPTTDLAILRVEAEIEASPVWLDDEKVKVGHLVLALGRPGERVQATLGVVSALGSAWRTAAGGDLTRYVQTDAVMYPGFSGGPLVNASGEFIGLNTSALVRGVSMTIPTSSLNPIATELIEYGQVKRGYLGVNLQVVRLPSGLEAELEQSTGLLISSIEKNSPASRSDLYLGDIVVKAAGAPIQHLDDLFAQLTGDRIGSRLPFSIIRAGDVLEIEVEIGSRS
jgi:S1-C subfamily serine protease